MRVSSPIGELPFEPTRIHYRNGAVEVDGLMGAWPAQVVIEPRDLPSLARLLIGPRTVAVVAAVGAATLILRRRTGSRN